MIGVVVVSGLESLLHLMELDSGSNTVFRVLKHHQRYRQKVGNYFQFYGEDV